MRRAISISIGSSERDHKAEIELLGERVQIERIGTDGDMEKATQLYNQLDGHVDAFGVGGADLDLCVADRTYPFPQIYRVIASDFLYIKRHMPSALKGKAIVTNTTTAEDVQLLRKRGVAYLVTTTPRLAGRSFGTNAMEAALVAAADKGRPLTRQEIQELLDRLEYQPSLEKL